MPLTSETRKYNEAFNAHRRASDRLQIAQDRIANCIRTLFTAMKDGEKAAMNAARAARAARAFNKARKALHARR